MEGGNVDHPQEHARKGSLSEAFEEAADAEDAGSGASDSAPTQRSEASSSSPGSRKKKKGKGKGGKSTRRASLQAIAEDCPSDAMRPTGDEPTLSTKKSKGKITARAAVKVGAAS